MRIQLLHMMWYQHSQKSHWTATSGDAFLAVTGSVACRAAVACAVSLKNCAPSHCEASARGCGNPVASAACVQLDSRLRGNDGIGRYRGSNGTVVVKALALLSFRIRASRFMVS